MKIVDINKLIEQFKKTHTDDLKIHQEKEKFPYITIKGDPNGENTKYCAICFGYEGKFIPLYDDRTCIICLNRKGANDI